MPLAFMAEVCGKSVGILYSFNPSISNPMKGMFCLASSSILLAELAYFFTRSTFNDCLSSSLSPS
jgi:hypothetical protein